MHIAPATVTAALDAASRLFRTPRAHILGRSRSRGLMLVRHAVTAAPHSRRASWPAIGRVLGRDPSTIQHGARVARRLAAADAEYAAAIRAIADEARSA